MPLRKLATVLPVVAVLALTGPVAGASAQTGSGSPATPASPAPPGSSIPCFPFPAWCDPTGQPLTPWPFTFQMPTALLAQLGWHLPSATATPTPTP